VYTANQFKPVQAKWVVKGDGVQAKISDPCEG